MDEIVISRAELAALPEYSCSLPTGTTIGKRWRASTTFGLPKESARVEEWKIAEYVEHPDPDLVGIKWAWAVVEPGRPHQGDLG